MTQVINEYLSWQFPHYRQEFLASRANSAIATLAHFAAATGTMARLDKNAAVVVVHLSQGGSFIREGALLALAKARGLPTVAHIHGSRFPQYSARHPRLVGTILRQAHQIIVLSAESNEAVKDLGLSARLVPNAVSPSASGEKRNLAVFAGAATQRKGVDTLLDAWRMLGRKASGWELIIAGPASEPELLTDVPGGVNVVGALPHSTVRTLLAEARLAVLPSRDEAMPLFILEAMASRAAVITTPVGGIPSVIDSGVNGFLVDPADVDALADAIASAIAEPSKTAAVADRGYVTWSERFSPRAIMPVLEDAWDAAASSATEP